MRDSFIGQGSKLLKNARYEEAIQLLVGVKEVDASEIYYFWHLLGQCYFFSYCFNESIQCYTNLLSNNPSAIWKLRATIYTAFNYFALKNKEECLKLINSFFQLLSNNIQFGLEESVAYSIQVLHDHLNSEIELHHIFHNVPQHQKPDFYHLLMIIFFTTNRTSSALACAKKIEEFYSGKLSKDLLPMLYQKANILWYLGHIAKKKEQSDYYYAKTKNTLQVMLKIDPKHIETKVLLNNLEQEHKQLEVILPGSVNSTSPTKNLRATSPTVGKKNKPNTHIKTNSNSIYHHLQFFDDLEKRYSVSDHEFESEQEEIKPTVIQQKADNGISIEKKEDASKINPLVTEQKADAHRENPQMEMVQQPISPANREPSMVSNIVNNEATTASITTDMVVTPNRPKTRSNSLKILQAAIANGILSDSGRVIQRTHPKIKNLESTTPCCAIL